MSEQLTPNTKEQYSEGNMPEDRDILSRSTTTTIEEDRDESTPSRTGKSMRTRRTRADSTQNEASISFLLETTKRLEQEVAVANDRARRAEERTERLLERLSQRERSRAPKEVSEIDDAEDNDEGKKKKNKTYRTSEDHFGMPDEHQEDIFAADDENDNSDAQERIEQTAGKLKEIDASIELLGQKLKDAETAADINRLLEGEFKTTFESLNDILSQTKSNNKKSKKPVRTEKPELTISGSKRSHDFEARKLLMQNASNVNDMKDQAYRTIEYFKQLRASTEAQKIDVNSIEDLATLIIQTNPELWQEKLPLLDENGNINQANFLEWIRESMAWHHDNDADNQINLWSLIELSTPYRSFNLGGMLRNKGKFFRTRDGQDLDELREQITREVWLFNTSRNDDLKYKVKMSSDQDTKDVLKEMYYVNTYTKSAFGKSTMRWIMTMPEKFIPPYAQRTQFDQESKQSDANVGESVRTAFLLYYHLSDTVQLQELLGEDKALFNRKEYEEYVKKRELNALKRKFAEEGKDVREREDLLKLGLKPESSQFVTVYEARKAELDTIFKKTRESTGSANERKEAKKTRDELEGKWLGSQEGGKTFILDDIFGKDDAQKIDPKNFNEFLNMFTGPETNSENISAVRAMIKKSLEELYPEKDSHGWTEKEYMDKIEDPETNAEEKKKLKERLKELKDKSTRSESFGMVNYAETWAFTMLRWSGAAARNDTGARSYDKWTELQLTKFKRLRDSDASRISAYGNHKNINLYKALAPDLLTGIVIQSDKKTSPYTLLMEVEAERRKWEKEHEQWVKAGRKEGQEPVFNIHEKLEKLEFTANAMGQFAAVQVANAVEILELITSAKELDFDKLFSIDKYGRVTLDEAALQEELKRFFKVFRNAYSTWGQIDFSAKIRVMVSNGDPPKYVTKSIAEAMFGDQILDIPEFLDANGKFDAKQMISGTYKNSHGKMIDKNGHEVDDPDKAHKFKYKELLWKQLVKGFIAAQIQAHRDLSSHYTQYDYYQVEAIYEVLETIPGKILHMIDTDKTFQAKRKYSRQLKRKKAKRDKLVRSGRMSVEEAKKEEEEDERNARGDGQRERTIKELVTVGHAFSHGDMDWIRKQSGTERNNMVARETIGSLFAGGWEGFKEFMKLMVEEMKR